MAKFLELFGVLSVASVAASFALGYASSAGAVETGTHMAVGFVAALLSILWVSVVMFYFIYTGSAIKKAAAVGLADSRSYQRSKEFKKKLFPLMMLAVVVFIFLPFLGASHDIGKYPLLYHTLCAWGALALDFGLLAVARRLLRENDLLFLDVVKAVDRAMSKRAGEK